MATQTKSRRTRKADSGDEPKMVSVAEALGGKNEDEHSLLDLSSHARRPFITVNDERHYLRKRVDFGSLEHQEFSRNSEEYDELWNKRQRLNTKQQKRYDFLLDWLFDHVLIDATATRAALEAAIDPVTGRSLLTGAVKREVVITFTNAPLLMAAMAQQSETKTETKTDLEPEDSSISES